MAGTQGESGRRKIVKGLLSVFLVFHVGAVFILPNPDSILYRQLESIVVPYGNLLGMNTTWRFFSPNPLLQILEYRLLDEEHSLADKIYRYPESVEAIGSREGYNRRLNFAMYMMSNVNFLREILTPYLCRQHPEATGLAFYSVARNFPAMERARLYRDRRDGIEELIKTHILDVDCEEDSL